MQKDKKIMFFSDLEGTLIDENGNINDEEFHQFISELLKLAHNVEADIELVIVSPIGPKHMSTLLKELDKRIFATEKNCRKPGEKNYSVDIIYAAADFKDVSEEDMIRRYDNRIFELPRTLNGRKIIDNESKGKFVKLILATEKEYPKKETKMYIYSGNGKNDESAMKIINELYNGITICPANSASNTKNIAGISSENIGIRGVTDCLKQIREKIEQRKIGINKKLEDEKWISKLDIIK